MPFPLFNPRCPDCDVRLKPFPWGTQIHTYIGYKCPKCEKDWDGTTLSEIFYQRSKKNE